MGDYQKARAWFLLAAIPIIGPLIIYLAKKDSNEGMAEVGKWLAIAQLAAFIPKAGALLGIAILLWRYFAETENAYRPWYMYFGLPIL